MSRNWPAHGGDVVAGRRVGIVAHGPEEVHRAELARRRCAAGLQRSRGRSAAESRSAAARRRARTAARARRSPATSTPPASRTGSPSRPGRRPRSRRRGWRWGDDDDGLHLVGSSIARSGSETTRAPSAAPGRDLRRGRRSQPGAPRAVRRGCGRGRRRGGRRRAGRFRSDRRPRAHPPAGGHGPHHLDPVAADADELVHHVGHHAAVIGHHVDHVAGHREAACGTGKRSTTPMSSERPAMAASGYSEDAPVARHGAPY